MAPDDTRTTSARCPAAASAATSASTRARSSPPGPVVREEEPTLTTIRLAAVTSGRTRPLCFARRVPPARDPISWRVMRAEDEYVEEVLALVERIPPGRVVPGHEVEALRRLRAERTPLRGERVDMRSAAWHPE